MEAEDFADLFHKFLLEYNHVTLHDSLLIQVINQLEVLTLYILRDQLKLL